jgi:hypothetical protein
MKIAKNMFLMGLGAASVLAFQKYGEEAACAAKEMIDMKIKNLKKMDEKLEDMM